MDANGKTEHDLWLEELGLDMEGILCRVDSGLRSPRGPRDDGTLDDLERREAEHWNREHRANVVRFDIATQGRCARGDGQLDVTKVALWQFQHRLLVNGKADDRTVVVALRESTASARNCSPAPVPASFEPEPTPYLQDDSEVEAQPEIVETSGVITGTAAGSTPSASTSARFEVNKPADWEGKITSPGGTASGSIGKGNASVRVGYEYDPVTGAELDGAKGQGRFAIAEGGADTPIGKVNISVGKTQGDMTVGHDYDPETKVDFRGGKLNFSHSFFEIQGQVPEQVEGTDVKGKYQLISVDVSSKNGMEDDQSDPNNGRFFLGTRTDIKGSAINLEGSGKRPLVSDSLETKAGSAEINYHNYIETDKDGASYDFKVNAETSGLKATGGREYRLTPKTLFDSTIGVWTNRVADDAFDFGPIIGVKGGADAAGVGAGLWGGGRLGADEISVHGGSGGKLFWGGAEGDLKVGWRLGPLKEEIHKVMDPVVGPVFATAKRVAAETFDREQQAVEDLASYVGDKLSEVNPDELSHVMKPHQTPAALAKEAASEVLAQVENLADAVREKLAEVDPEELQNASNAGAAVSDLAQSVSSTASEVAEQVKESTGEVANQVSAAVANVADSSAAVADSVVSAATETWDSIFS